MQRTFDMDADMIGTPAYTALKTLSATDADTVVRRRAKSGAVSLIPAKVSFNEEESLSEGQTTVEFMAKAMRKTEWAALRDAHLNYVKPTGDEDEAIKFSYAKAVGEDMRWLFTSVTSDGPPGRQHPRHWPKSFIGLARWSWQTKA